MVKQNKIKKKKKQPFSLTSYSFLYITGSAFLENPGQSSFTVFKSVPSGCVPRPSAPALRLTLHYHHLFPRHPCSLRDDTHLLFASAYHFCHYPRKCSLWWPRHNWHLSVMTFWFSGLQRASPSLYLKPPLLRGQCGCWQPLRRWFSQFCTHALSSDHTSFLIALSLFLGVCSLVSLFFPFLLIWIPCGFTLF